MPITSERFEFATVVVEAGVEAAGGLLRVPKEERLSARETHAFLSDDLRDKNLSPDALLDLLTVALMIIAYERESGERRNA